MGALGRSCLAGASGLCVFFGTQAAQAHGDAATAGIVLIMAGSGIAFTAYDVTLIAQEEVPSPGWAWTEAIMASLFTATFVGVNTDVDMDDDMGAGFLAVEGWFAVQSGYAIGSIAGERPRAGLIGATSGLLATSWHQAALTLAGKHTHFSTSITQSVLAAPAILGGTLWAIDAASPGERAAYVTFASLAGASFAHGIVAAVIENSRPAPKPADRNTAFAPRFAIVPASGGWQASVFGCW
jgi:hypothetical protein